MRRGDHAYTAAQQWQALVIGGLTGVMVAIAPFDWQARFNENDLPVDPHAIDEPVAEEHLAEAEGDVDDRRGTR